MTPMDIGWLRISILGLGDTDKALDEYAALYQQHPKNVEVKKSYIDLLLQKGRIDEAKKLTDEILKSNSKDVMANLFAADSQIRSGDYSGAITRLVDVTKNEPDNVGAHFFLA